MGTSTIGNNLANMSGSVSFACPSCGKSKILRTRNEREIVAKYVCTDCGFTGPN